MQGRPVLPVEAVAFRRIACVQDAAVIKVAAVAPYDEPHGAGAHCPVGSGEADELPGVSVRRIPQSGAVRQGDGAQAGGGGVVDIVVGDADPGSERTGGSVEVEPQYRRGVGADDVGEGWPDGR